MAKQSNWDYYKEQIPAPLRNKFILTTAIFVFWMFFLDKHSIISQYRLQVTLQELKSKKLYYETEIQQANKDNKELFTNQETLEKFAREHYWMKKPDEDLFIVTTRAE